MTINAANWVGENTATVGTGAIVLGGAIDGFARFNVMGDGQVYYCVQDGLAKETGIGTLDGNTLSRTTITATIDKNGIYSSTPAPLALSGNAQVFGIINADFMKTLFNGFDEMQQNIIDSKAYADAAKVSEQNSKASETASASSESNAKTYQDNANTAAMSASGSAATATISAATATTKAQESADSASAAYISEVNSANSAAEAKSYADGIAASGAMLWRGNIDSTVNINTLGPGSTTVGVWGQYTTPTVDNGYPVAETGILSVFAGSSFGCQQTYITSTGNIYTRTLSASWNGTNGPWSTWKPSGDSIFAKKGSNSDITSLSGIAQNITLIRDESISEAGVKWTTDSTIGISLGTENTNGGSATFHNFSKGVGGTNTKDGALTGGYGSRPFDGNDYTEHSTAAIHFIQAGDCTPSNHGTWLRFMVTNRDTTQLQRFSPFALSENGDMFIGNAIPWGMHHFIPMGLDGRGMKQMCHYNSEVAVFADAPNNVTVPGVNFRGAVCSGTVDMPQKTLSGSNVFLSLSGHNGVGYQNANGAIAIVATADWTPTSNPVVIRFSTTSTNETTRVDRWEMRSNTFTPVQDGLSNLGTASTRVSAVYAVNGQIQTSDAREKTPVRKFTQNEINASKQLAAEIGFYSWLIQKDINDVREHCGMTVQRAIEIMEENGLDPFNYGFICYDKWDEHETSSSYDEEDNPIVVTVPAGDRYSFRIDQINLFIAKGLEARITALENSIK